MYTKSSGTIYQNRLNYRHNLLLRERKKVYMPPRISRCIICGQFFGSKKELREHKNKNHRITNSKIVPAGKNKDADSGSSEKSTSNDQKMIEYKEKDHIRQVRNIKPDHKGNYRVVNDINPKCELLL
jgi:hypothetical protein